MIRLTELGRHHTEARVRLEGALTGAGLEVLRTALEALRDEGIESVDVEADGLVLVDRLALRQEPTVTPAGLTLRFTTTRRSLRQLLADTDVDVRLVPPAGRDHHT